MAAVQPKIVVLDDVNQYEEVLGAIVEWAQDQQRRQSARRPLAIVLDIDETALLNKGKRVYRNVYVYAFYRHMLRLNVAVFFVTARSTKYRHHTENQLARLGYDRYEELFLMPPRLRDPARFKRNVRRMLIQRGYHIFANLGDQWTDMESGYFDVGIKLPEDDGTGDDDDDAQ